MIKFNLVLIIGMFCSLSFSYSQNYITEKTASPKLREEYNEGYKLIQKEDYLKAAKVFSNVLKKEPRFLDAHIQLGLCLEKTKSIDGAIEAYKNALKIDTLYYPRVLYLLAVQLKKKEFYSDAIYLLDRYISISKASPEALAYAKRIKEVCQIYLLSKEEGYVFKPENLGPSINTQNLEYLPCLTVDGETLIFTRRIGEAEDFYFSNIVGNKWSIAKPIIGLNTPGNEGAETISADGKTIVFTGCKYPDSKGGCDLYISHLKNGNWTKPINMGSPINTEAWESEPSLSADGNIIYFSSDRKGGFGGSDIYVSYKTENEKWSKPVPLPKPINNEYNTESAFMHPDGKTLYFRCQGLPGLGGYDLYISRLNDMNVWSEPLNMGVGINTERDEGALIIDLNGKYGYFASDGKLAPGIENYGGVDIYRFEVPEKFKPQPVTYVKAKVSDMNTGKSITTDIQIQDLTNYKAFNKSTTDDDGTFLVCLPVGKSYALNVSKDKYTFYSEHFSLNEVKSKNDPYLLDIKLQKIDGAIQGTAGTPVVLKNIFFDTGSSTLRNDSEYELQKLIDFLSRNTAIKIRINGHTDNVGKIEDNLKLSLDRAKAVYDYLIKRGIPASQLTYKGFGETKALKSNDTDENKQLNRRIEFEITNN